MESSKRIINTENPVLTFSKIGVIMILLLKNDIISGNNPVTNKEKKRG